MERVAFLVERTGERIPCLLNPDSVVARRTAGVRSMAAGSTRLTALDLTDDPVLLTGGGRTEFELDLLFDTSLLGSEQRPAEAPGTEQVDVRSLTGPIWRLAENASGAGSFGGPPLARIVWGTSWNVLGVVTAIAERIENFAADGTPARSWLRMRLLRVAEQPATPDLPAVSPAILESAANTANGSASAEDARGSDATHEVLGDGGGEPDESSRGERLDEIASRYYPGMPWMWRYLASANSLDTAPWVPRGTVLRIPPPADLGSANAGDA